MKWEPKFFENWIKKEVVKLSWLFPELDEERPLN